MPSSYSTIRKNIRLDCTHRVFFTKDSFSMANDTLSEILQPHREGRRTKTLVYLDEGILDGNPNLPDRINQYFRGREDRLQLVIPPVFIRGGEAAKNDWSLVERIWKDVNDHAMCRHSYVIVIGGGRRFGFGRFRRLHCSSRHSTGTISHHDPEPGRWWGRGQERGQLLWKEKLGRRLFRP